ncbi:MAG TPA: helix-turn-helix domain-containing protein [Bacillota bacterium]
MPLRGGKRVADREPELLTLTEAIKALRISRRTAYRWLQDGTLPAVKIGGRWRVRREDLDALLRGEKPRKT